MGGGLKGISGRRNFSEKLHYIRQCVRGCERGNQVGVERMRRQRREAVESKV